MNKDLEMERALTPSNFMLTAIVTKTKRQIFYIYDYDSMKILVGYF